MTVPDANIAQRTTCIGWYRCWVKVPDNWATLGGRDLWVESVTLTIDSSHTAHEAYLNGKRLGGSGTFPPDAAAGDGLAKRYKVPPGSLAKGKWNELSIKVFNRDGTGRLRGSGPSIQGYFLECFFSGEWEYRGNAEPALGQVLSAKPSRSAYDQFHEASRVLFEAQKLVHGERLSTAESLKKFELAQALVVETVLHEPLVAQPTHLSLMHADGSGSRTTSSTPTRPGCAKLVATSTTAPNTTASLSRPRTTHPAAGASPSTRTPIAMAPTTPTRCSSTN